MPETIAKRKSKHSNITTMMVFLVVFSFDSHLLRYTYFHWLQGGNDLYSQLMATFHQNYNCLHHFTVIKK